MTPSSTLLEYFRMITVWGVHVLWNCLWFQSSLLPLNPFVPLFCADCTISHLFFSSLRSLCLSFTLRLDCCLLTCTRLHPGGDAAPSLCNVAHVTLISRETSDVRPLNNRKWLSPRPIRCRYRTGAERRAAKRLQQIQWSAKSDWTEGNENVCWPRHVAVLLRFLIMSQVEEAQGEDKAECEALVFFFVCLFARFAEHLSLKVTRCESCLKRE